MARTGYHQGVAFPRTAVPATPRPILFAAACLALLGMGCYVQSFHPLYTDATVSFDPELVGTWVAEEDEEFVFTLVDTTRGAYTLLCEEGGSTARFEAVMVELGGERFLDIYPDPPATDNSFYQDHLFRVHNILHLRRDADTLWVADFDAEWLETAITKKRVNIAHVGLDGAVLLTAPTDQLQAFARKYAKTPEAFSEPVRLRRMN
jgi:hypothetical protein